MNNFFEKQKPGVSLFFVILIMSVLSAALLSLVNLSLSQIKIVSRAEDSVMAFFAADSGIEEALYRIRKQENQEDFSGTIDGATYEVLINTQGQNTTITAIGEFQNTKRAIESGY